MPLARPIRSGLGFAYQHDGGDLSTAVHRCVGVGKCRADTTASGGLMCPSWLATRDEKIPPAAARACCRSSRTARWSRVSVPQRWPSRWSCACRARAVRRTARPGWTWRPPRPRCCISVAAPAATAGRLWLGWLPRSARAGLARPGPDQRRAAQPGAGRYRKRLGESTPAGRCRSSAATTSVTGSPAIPRVRTAVLLWVDTSPTTSGPRSARPRAGLRRPATVQSPGSPCAAADLDLHRPAERRAQAAAAQPAGPGPGGAARHPDRRAEPWCTAVLRREIAELLPHDPRA